MLATDSNPWEVINGKKPDAYNVVSVRPDENKVVAENMTLSAAVQIVDEHDILLRFREVLKRAESTPISVTRGPYL